MKADTKAYIKVEKVIESCQTLEQLQVADKMIDNYRKFFEPKTPYFNKGFYRYHNAIRDLSMQSMYKYADLQD